MKNNFPIGKVEDQTTRPNVPGTDRSIEPLGIRRHEGLFEIRETTGIINLLTSL